MPYCASCGTESSTNKFCNHCGSPVNAQAAQTQVAAGINTAGSKKAMWVHLAPLLMATVSTFIGPSLFSSINLGVVTDVSMIGVSTLAYIPLLLLWLPALIVRVSSSSTPFEKNHAGTALNFQISLFLYIVAVVGIALAATYAAFSNVNVVLMWVIVPIMALALMALGIMALVFNIMGTVAGNAGREYRYPIAIRFLK